MKALSIKQPWAELILEGKKIKRYALGKLNTEAILLYIHQKDQTDML